MTPGAPVLKTGSEWAESLGVTILDPDGWRTWDGVTLDDPISRLDFERRLMVSTVKMPTVEGIA